jgi:hypothetical protein
LEKRLGRANGNIYHRRPGVEGVHDGQVMVRLKKKRFIVIDYSIQPNEADFHHAAMSPYIRIPDGAGKVKCTVAECNKVGVPVLLYDSEPHEPQSLYLRSGLCFTCQRNLNEKRRTQRKKSPDNDDGMGVAGSKKNKAGGMSMGYPSTLGAAGSIVPYHQVLMAVTSGNKRIKLAHTNEPLALAQDAIILNGPPDPTCKSARNGHGFSEIGMDLAQTAKQSLQSTQALVHAVDPSSGGDILNHHQLPPTSDEIARLYETSFSGLCKSLYLLTQWKESWDAAMAAAIHSQHMVIPPQASSVDHHAHHLANAIPDIHHHHPLSPTLGHSLMHDPLHPSLSGMSSHHQHHSSVDDPAGLADAVASAAAVAAGADESSTSSNHHHHVSKADSDLMAAAAAAAVANGDGHDDAATGVIEL